MLKINLMLIFVFIQTSFADTFNASELLMKGIGGLAFAFQMFIVVGVWYLLKFIYQKITSKNQENDKVLNINEEVKQIGINQSEGMNRIVLISSIILPIGWLTYVLIITEGFSKIHTKGWGITIGITILGYFLPIIVSKIIFWIQDGFKKDNNEN